MYELTKNVEQKTAILHYGIVVSVNKLAIDRRIRDAIYHSVDCIINQMIRRLGVVLGPKYIYSDALPYWQHSLRTDRFSELYATYQNHIKSGLLCSSPREPDVYRPIVDIFKLTKDNDGETELHELEGLGLGLRITTGDILPPHTAPLRMCSVCCVFMPATIDYFDEIELYSFDTANHADVTTIGICTSCKHTQLS